jgi:CRISPR-associated endonuclease/helicase Cas3
MDEMIAEEIKAKSTGESLAKHLDEVAAYAKQINESYDKFLRNLLEERRAEKIKQALELAAAAHDLGKAAAGFQAALQDPNHRWDKRHEIYSTGIILGLPAERGIKELAAIATLTHHRDILNFLSPSNEISKFDENDLAPNWHFIEQWVKTRYPSNTPRIVRLKEEFVKRAYEESKKSPFLSRRWLELTLARGWLLASDHAVSAGLTTFPTKIARPNWNKPLRKFQEIVGNYEGNAILEAPTGAGKTLAAILWAQRNRIGGERIFYILPYQASIEAMADTLEGFWERETVGTIHGRALDCAFIEYFEEIGEYGTAEAKARQENNVNRLVHKQIKVVTPYQLLKWFLGIPRWEIGVSEMIGGLFIFDEIHAYDAHVVGLIIKMVEFLRKLGGRFLFMSATFPNFLKRLLTKAVGGNLKEFTLTPTDEVETHLLFGSRHRIRWRDAHLEELIPEIVAAAKEGQRVLVVANRVSQAQEIYRTLKEKVEGVYLLHSRFTRRDRTEKERRIIGSLKDTDDTEVQVLVATQVVEVSLDISFDVLYTEIAPVDDLLQRFGRVNRYGEHPAGVEVHVATKYDNRLHNIYGKERLKATLNSGPKDNAELPYDVCSQWIKKVYKGWTKSEKEKFSKAMRGLEDLCRELKPLTALCEKDDHDLEGFLSHTIEVLPKCLEATFNQYWNNKEYLLAFQLLVPVPFWVWEKLPQKTKKIGNRKEISVTDTAYDSEEGLKIEIGE